MIDIITSDIQTIIESSWINWTQFNEKTVYISGVSGQIGKYLVALFNALYDKGIKVKILGICRKPSALFEFFDKHNIVIHKELITVIEHDVREYIYINDKIDYYFLAASPTSPKSYQDSPVDVFEINLLGALNAFKIALKQKNEDSKIIVLSSSTVYGNIDESTIVDENNFGSFDPLDVRGSYGESKRAIETLAMSYNTQFGLDIRIARIRRVYGPTVNLSDSLFGNLLNTAVQGGTIQLFKGCEMIQPIYISDVVSGLITILTNQKEAGIVYNLCSNDALRMDELAEMIQKESDNNLLIKYVERSGINDRIRTSKKNNVNNGIMSNEKLMMSGWQNKISLENGIRRTILDIKYFKE